MRDCTTTILQKIETTALFSNVGVPLNKVGVRFLPSWQAAVENCSSEIWTSVTEGNRGRMVAVIREKDKDRFDRQWNEVVREVKRTLQPLINLRLDQILLQFPSLPRKPLFDDMCWCLLHICMAEEYSNMLDREFYGDLATWYLGGRYPCGWDPNLNGGTLLIY